MSFETRGQLKISFEMLPRFNGLEHVTDTVALGVKVGEVRLTSDVVPQKKGRIFTAAAEATEEDVIMEIVTAPSVLSDPNPAEWSVIQSALWPRPSQLKRRTIHFNFVNPAPEHAVCYRCGRARTKGKGTENAPCVPREKCRVAYN